MSDCRVAIFEDYEPTCLTLQWALEDRGYRVVSTAMNVQEADKELAAIERGEITPDVVVVDGDLHGAADVEDGRKIIDEIKRISAERGYKISTIAFAGRKGLEGIADYTCSPKEDTELLFDTIKYIASRANNN